MGEITAVTFDLWQTLLLDDRDVGLARTMVRIEGARAALARFGEDYGLEHIQEAYWACYRRCSSIRKRHMDVSFREQVDIFIDYISPGLVRRLDQETIDEIAGIYADSFLVRPPSPHPDALNVLTGLKDIGLSLGLISNTGMTPGTTFRRFLENEGMLAHFDALTFSDEVLISKPSSEIFLMTLRAMSAAPEQTVHVGDHVVNDVVGAKRCGLKTVWIEGFYERDDPQDPDSEPDATVADLGQVVQAIARLSGRA